MQLVTEAGHLFIPGQKVSLGYLTYPNDVRDTTKSGKGCMDNHRLHYLVEFISVNVGGLLAEVRSPPAKQARVGGSIVVGGRESLLHGEGNQGINVL
jgi:hypothetical protein